MKSHSYTALTVLLLLPSATLLGCGGRGGDRGGGPHLTKSEFNKRVSALCTEMARSEDALPTPASWADTEKLETVLVGEGKIYKRFFSALSEVRAPSAEQGTVDQIMRLSAKLIELNTGALSSLKNSGFPWEDPKNAAAFDETNDEIKQLLYSDLGVAICSNV